jgi:cobalt-zinc-cadmium efflux system outer membrane protein
VKRSPSALPVAVTLLSLSLSACVSESSAFGDVNKVVAARTGHEAHWSHLGGDSEAQKATQEALSKPLTVETAVQVALLNSAELQAAFEDVGVARGDLVSAWRIPNPTAEAGVRFHDEGSPALDFSVTEDLSELIFLPLRVGVANAELDAAKLEVAGKAMDLVFQVRSAFYRYLADLQIVELRGTVLDALAASATTAKALHDAGNITELDLANEQVLYDEARVNLAAAQASIAASREQLSSLLGLWGRNDVWKVDARLAEPSDLALSDLETKAVQSSLELQVIRHRYTAAAKRANLERAAGLLPELKAGIAVEREDDEWSYGPVAELEVPLFYQGQGEVARARAQMRRQGQLLRARAVQIRAAARTAAMRVAATRDRASYFKNVLLPARQRILNQAQLQFNAMNLSVFQLLLAKRDQVETARSYVEALRDYWLARAEAEQLRSGRLTPGTAIASSDVPTSSSAPAAPH